MEYYTKNEAIKETGLTTYQIRYYIECNYFKNCIQRPNHIWLIPKDEIEKLKSDLKFIEESYTLKEVATILGYSASNNIKNLFDSFFSNSYKFIFQKYYVQKSAIDYFVKRHPEFNLIKSGQYTSLSQVAKMIKKPIYVLDNMIERKYISNVLKHPINGNYFILNSEVARVKEIFKYMEESYTLEQMCPILSCEYSKITSYRRELCGIFPDNKFYLKQFFFKKDQVNLFLSKLTDQEQTLESLLTNYAANRKDINGHRIAKYIAKPRKKSDNSISLNNKISDNFITLNNKIYVNVENPPKSYNVTPFSLKNIIKRKKIVNFIYYRRQYWIEKNELDEIYALYSNSIDFSNISEDYLSQSQKNNIRSKHLIKHYFPNSFKFEFWGNNSSRIPLSDLEAFKTNFLPDIKKKDAIQKEQNPQELYKLLTEECNQTKFMQTFNSYNEFFLIKLNTTNVKNIRNYVFSLASSIGRLLNVINKEVYLYTDNELEIILRSPELTCINKLYISMFVNFCKNKYKNECKYNNIYNHYISSTKNNFSSDVYSEEKWIQYFHYLTDIDKHIKNAFLNARYSKIWLYTILHLSIAWRREDILSFPAINFIDMDKYTFEWFENNIFTITDAQIIINYIKDISDTLLAGKTGAKNHFLISPILIIPTSIAFIASEFHRKKNNEPTLFGRSKFFKSDFKDFFKDKDLQDFQNTKANRTLITLNFNNAVTTEGMCTVAYSLSTYLRSHKINSKFELAPTTAQYIYSTNSDGDANNVAYNLFQRGYFGWLYYTLLKLVKQSEETSLNDITSSIIKVKNLYSPFVIESFSAYLQHEYEERKSVIKDLMITPKENIKEKLFHLSRGELPSKVYYTQCLMYGSCPYKINVHCIGCKYSIPTNYTLCIIKTELESLTDKLLNENIQNTLSRQRLTFQITKLLFLLSEAKIEFDKLDKNYISSFINLKELKRNIEKLEKTKFLLF